MNKVEIVLGIITIISFIIAFPQIFGSNWKDLYSLVLEGKVSWNLVHKSSIRIIRELYRDKFFPICILGIGRGGVLAAGILSSEFNKHVIVNDSENGLPPTSANLKIGVINSKVYLKKEKKHEDKGNQILSRVDKIEYSDIDININSNEQVLIITAQSYRGESFQNILDKLDSLGIPRNNIKTATLFWHRHKQINVLHEPDIYGKITSINKTMPWKDSKNNTDRY